MSNHKKLTIDSYNKTAKEYDENVSEFEILPSLNNFIALVKQGGRILDLGCGPGQHSRIFVDEGFTVKGIDLSSEMIKIAKEKVPEASFEVMDIGKLDFDNNSFDGIWASASLIHISKDDIESVLSSLKMNLKNFGIFYLSLKEGQGEELFIDHRYGGVKKFYAYYTSIEIIKILEDLNFRIISSTVTEKRIAYDTNRWIHIFCAKR